MLMKVDTNTKGNTYWFMFKVSEFKVGQKYKFNIVNFTRNVEKFYNSGMNICCKSEVKGAKKFIHEEGEDNISIPTMHDLQQDEETQWEYNLCSNIQFIEKCEVPRLIRQNKETGEIIYARYFSKLTFSYTFRPQDQGKTVTFAYSVPYGYTDLLKDLDDIKVNLLASEELQNYVSMDAKDEHEIEEEKSHHRPESNILVDCRKQGDGYDSDDYYLGAPTKPQAIQGGQGASLGDQGIVKKSKLIPDINQKSDMRVVVNSKNAFKVSEDPNTLKPSDKKGENQKVSQYEIQHMNIKREALELKQVNLFERKFFDGQFGDKRNISQFKNNKRNLENRNKFRDQNFDIHLKTLLYRQEIIGQSICGLNIYQLTLTKKKEYSIRYKKKKVMYIQARLHAAETHGSLIMKKIMHEFTQNHEKYDKIFHNYIVKIIPMINPDGVVIGNSRCSLAGLDLNRRWSEPNPIMHPEIFYIKNNMKLVEKQSGGISMFCDLHGHNKQMNAFIYGCNKAPNEGLLSWTKTRLLPKILASIEPIFDFNKCVFSQEKFKYNTARVVVWNEFKVTNSFTLETSMFGKKLKSVIERSNQVQKMKMVTSQLTINDFDSIGICILKSFLTYTQLEIQLEKEYKATGGWLKKKKMDSITGETARQKKEQEHIMKLHMERAQTKKLLTLQKSQFTPAGNDHKLIRSQISRPKDANDLQDQKVMQDGKQSRYSIVTKNLNSPIAQKEKEPNSATIDKPSISISPDKRDNKEKPNLNDQETTPVLDKDKGDKKKKGVKPKKSQTVAKLTLKPQDTELQNQDSQESQRGTSTKKSSSPRKQDEAKNLSKPTQRAKIAIQDEGSGTVSAKQPGTKSSSKQGAKSSNILQKGNSHRNVLNQSSFRAKKVIEPEEPIDGLLSDELNNSPLMQQMNWMSFFEENEFESALIESKKPISKKPIQSGKQVAESDSEPSCDNFEEEELIERFEPAATQEEPINLSQKAQEKQDQLKAELDKQQRIQIEKYVQQQKKQQEHAQQNQLAKDQEMIIQQQQQFKQITQNLNQVQKQNSKLSKRMDFLTQQITDQIIYEKQNQKKTINTLKEMTQAHQMPTHLNKNQLPPKFCQFEKTLIANSESTSPMPMMKLNSTDTAPNTKQSIKQQPKLNQFQSQYQQMNTQPQKSNNFTLNTLQLHEASVRSSFQNNNYNYNSEINHQQLKQTKQNIINQMFESTHSNNSTNPQLQFQQRMMQKEYSNHSSSNQLPGFDTIAPSTLEREFNYKEIQQDSEQIKNQNLELKHLIKSLSPNRNLQKPNQPLPNSQFSHQNLLSQSPKISTQYSLRNNLRLQQKDQHQNTNPSSLSLNQDNPCIPQSIHSIEGPSHQSFQTQQIQQPKGILNRQNVQKKNTISSIRQKMQEEYLIDQSVPMVSNKSVPMVSKRESQSKMPKIRKALEITDPLQLNRKYGKSTVVVSNERKKECDNSANMNNTNPSDDEMNYVMINKKVSPSEMQRQILENKDYPIHGQRFVGSRTVRGATIAQNEMTDSSYSSTFIGDVSPDIRGSRGNNNKKRLNRNDPNKDPNLALKMFKMNNSFDHNQQSDYNYQSPEKAKKIPTMRNHSYFTNNPKYKMNQESRFLSPQKSDREFSQIQQQLPPAIKANSSPLNMPSSGGKLRQINQFPKKMDKKLVLPQVISKPLGVENQSDINQNWDYNQTKLRSPLARGPNPKYPNSQGNSIHLKNKNQVL